MFEDLKQDYRGGRNLRTKVISWAIFGAIILVFILWGLSPRGASGMMGTGGGVAQVNSTTISARDLNDAVNQMEQNMQGSPYASFFQGEAGQQRLREMALRQLIQGELVYQACVANQMLPSDQAVAAIIRGAPIFIENGQFKRERYINYIENLRTTPAEFEEKLRRGSIAQDAQRLFSDALRSSPQEVKKQMELRDLKADVEYAELSSQKLVTSDQVTNDEAKAMLAQSEGEKKAKDYYASHPADFNTDEKVHARHILIKFDAKNTDSVKMAQKKAEDLLGQIKKGGDFAKLAKENSDDPGSKAKGGELEPFGRGAMVPEFEKAAFSLQPNAVSDLVKSQYGYHIIQVLDKVPKTSTSFDSAKLDIAKKLLAEKKSEDTLSGLRELLKKSDLAGVDQFVSSHKLKWDTTGPFSITAPSVPKVGNNDEFARIAFSLTSKKPLATELVRQGDKAYIIKYQALTAKELAAAKPNKLNKNIKPGNEPANPKVETAEEVAQNLTYQSSQDAFQGWLENVKKNSRIETTKDFASSQSSTPDDY